jgi:hypothetical protein
MATEIQPHHIGEVVLAGLLRRLAQRDELDIPCVLHEKCQFSTVHAEAEIGPPLTFSANVPLASVVINRENLLFDGAHGIDVLCSSPEARGLAVESKLGLDRMAPESSGGASSLTCRSRRTPVGGSKAAWLPS